VKNPIAIARSSAVMRFELKPRCHCWGLFHAICWNIFAPRSERL